MSAGFLNNMTYQTNTPTKPEKQGIVSILSSEINSSQNILSTNNNNISPNFSIRRTFSADMSSPKWLQNNGFPLKKVQSSHQLQALDEEDNNDENNNDHDHDHIKGPAFEDVWSSIQAEKKSWGSILEKNDGPKSGSDLGLLPPPYVHPLVKRSASSLSEKSLEICTESLGSESGSDGFSDKEHHEPQEEEEKKEVEVKGCNSNNAPEVVGNCIKYNNNGNGNGNGNGKRFMMVPPTKPSFPPPLPSLANRDGGSNLHIRSHRQDGRLVVEAVSVPSQNCFRVKRQDGRLLLTLTTTHQQEQANEVVDLEDDDAKNNKEQGEEAKVSILMTKENDDIPKDQVINVQRSCPTLTMMSKIIKKSTWPRPNFNTTVIKTLNDNENEDEGKDEKTDEKKVAEMTLSYTLLPPHQPKVSTATAALNAYEYYWRRSNSPASATVTMLNPLARQHNNNNNNNYADAPQVEEHTKGNNNKKLLFAAHNTKVKGVALAKQDVVVVKAARRRGGATSTEEKGEYLVPFMLRGCKDNHKSSFFLLDPYCIAT